VTGYPTQGRRWQISTEGGDFAQWNPKGGELFYWNGRQMMVVAVTTGANFSAGRPRLLYTGQLGLVSPDGQRFVIAGFDPLSPPSPITIVTGR